MRPLKPTDRMPDAGVSNPEYHALCGVELVTIPVWHYAELLEAQRLSAERSISHDQFERPSRSIISRNPEVAVFLAQNLGLRTAKELKRDCQRQFGKGRVPSEKSIYRYWRKLRIEEKRSRGLAGR